MDNCVHGTPCAGTIRGATGRFKSILVEAGIWVNLESVCAFATVPYRKLAAIAKAANDDAPTLNPHIGEKRDGSYS